MTKLMLAAVAAVCLTACGSDNFGRNVDRLTAAGCRGTVHVEGAVGTATGLSPGAANGRMNFDASCDPANRTAPAQ